MISLNYCQFWSALDHKPLIFFTTPVETSLNRLKQKLLWNVTDNDWVKSDEKVYFITLTVDEDNYPYVFQQQSGSACMRSFCTLNRNWFTRGSVRKGRPSYKFELLWRLERGKNFTQRLHFHSIFKTDAPLDVVRERFIETWDYCQWDKLDVEKSFQLLDDRNLATLYACKYTSKIVKHFDAETGQLTDESESAAKTRQELHSRLWSCSRGFKPIKKSHFMFFDWDIHVWLPKVKRNYRQFHPENKELWKQMFKTDFESDVEFEKRFYPINPDFINGNFVIHKNIWYLNYAKFTKIGIFSKKNIVKKEEINDWIAENEIRNEEILALCDYPEVIPSLKEKVNYVAQYFSYDKPEKSIYRKIYKEYLDNRVIPKDL